MDTIAPKTPDPLPFSTWQEMAPDEAASEIHSRVATLSPALRRAALAWLCPQAELAATIDAARSRGHPLAGVPYLAKDLFDLAGVPTFAGSTFLPEVRPTPSSDSRLVRQLTALGASCAGKTHLVEFASGLTGENPHYGDCPHPHFPDRLTGGSSSGSAALVAAGVTPLALGTDTGGSVRVPAAWCGLHGFRLTPHQEFITDAFPLAPSLDTAGWFTANAADLLTAWQHLLAASPSLAGHGSHRGAYLGLRTLLPDADPTLADACDAAAERLCPAADRALAAHLQQSWREAVDAYVTIGMSEAHAVHRAWLPQYRDRYDPVIWQRFTDAGNFSAQKIEHARAVMHAVKSGFADLFRHYDFLVLPAVPSLAPRKAEATPELRRRIITLTAPASLAGLPVLSLPVAVSGGLTAGLQIVLPDAVSPVVPWLLTR